MRVLRTAGPPAHTHRPGRGRVTHQAADDRGRARRRQPPSGVSVTASPPARPSASVALPWLIPRQTRPYESSYSSGSPGRRSPNVGDHGITWTRPSPSVTRKRRPAGCPTASAELGREGGQLRVAERVHVHDLGREPAVDTRAAPAAATGRASTGRGPARATRTRRRPRGGRRPGRTRPARGTSTTRPAADTPRSRAHGPRRSRPSRSAAGTSRPLSGPISTSPRATRSATGRRAVPTPGSTTATCVPTGT